MNEEQGKYHSSSLRPAKEKAFQDSTRDKI